MIPESGAVVDLADRLRNARIADEAKHGVEDAIKEHQEEALDILLRALKDSGRLSADDSVAAVHILSQLRPNDYQEFEGYLLDADGLFLEPKHGKTCEATVRAVGCGWDTLTECAKAAIGVRFDADEPYPACEEHFR